jgi:hypothetical protein
MGAIICKLYPERDARRQAQDMMAPHVVHKAGEVGQHVTRGCSLAGTSGCRTREARAWYTSPAVPQSLV